MAREVLDYVIWEMGQAFDTLFHNLKDLRDDDWMWVPQGGARSISAIVLHLASSKVMFDNHAFGDGSLSWESPLFADMEPPANGDAVPPAKLFERLRDAQLRLLRNVDALGDDEELRTRRPVDWGGTRETRWIITRLINHDGYHAGEINHIRSIHQQNDRWAWEQWEDQQAAQ